MFRQHIVQSHIISICFHVQDVVSTFRAYDIVAAAQCQSWIHQPGAGTQHQPGFWLSSRICKKGVAPGLSIADKKDW